jgi:putative salt-induced outer membrane protein YdiY
MHKSIAMLVLMILSSHGLAISNIESERPGWPEEGWSGHLELGLSGENGNSKEKDYSFAAKVTNRIDNNIYLGIAEGAYGEANKVKDTDDAFLHARWIRVLNERWAAEGFTQWEDDEFDHLESRTLLGGGGRYVVAADQDLFSLSVGLGAFREKEVVDLDTFERTNWAWRLNSFLVYKHRLNDQVVINLTNYYQPDLDHFSDFRVLLTASMSVKINASLDLKLHFKGTHDSEPDQNPDANPPIYLQSTNTEYVTSLVYNF